jgi:capsular exopolysaccharide synthesis family protein
MLPAPAHKSAPLSNSQETQDQVPEETGAVGSSPASAATPAALFKAFRRRWLLAASAGLLCGLAGFAVVWFLLPLGKHTAHSLIQVSANQPQIIFPTAETRSDFASYRRTQMALIKSRWVLNTALRQPNVAALDTVQEHLDPVQWLEANLKVDNTLGPELVRVSLTGDDPDELKVLVQAVTKAYMEEIVNEERRNKLSRHEHLKELYTRYEERLRDKRKAQKALADAIGTSNSTNAAIKQRLALEQLAIAQKELAQVRSDKTRLQVMAAAQEAQGKSKTEVPVAEALLEEQVQQDAAVKKHVEEVSKLESKLEEIRQVATPARFQAVSQDTRDKLNAARRALEERRRRVRPLLVARLRAKIGRDARSEAGKLKERVGYMNQLETRLQKDVDRLARESQSINKQSSDLEALRDEIAQDEALMKRVGNEVAALDVERDAPSRVRVREDGVVTSPFNQAKRILAAGGAGGLGLSLALFGVIWWEFRSRRISSVEEVVQKLGLRLMGTLPHLPERVRHPAGKGSTARDLHWHNLLTESVDATRTLLLHEARSQPLRLVMITSATAGEGKTSLATQLAVSLARARRRTLLVDCDLRNPTAHRLFDVAREPGFCELLCAEAELAEVVRPTGMDGLSIIPAGRGDADAIQELCQDRCGQIFGELKEMYDFVVVDSSPVLPVADALLIGQHMDGVVFSVLHEVSQLPKVHAAHQRLEVLSIRILGAVVNGAPGSGEDGADYQYLATAAAE